MNREHVGKASDSLLGLAHRGTAIWTDDLGKDRPPLECETQIEPLVGERWLELGTDAELAERGGEVQLGPRRPFAPR